MNVVIVVFGDAAAVWHEVPGVGWSVDAVEWGVEALLPDDIRYAARGHVGYSVFSNLVT